MGKFNALSHGSQNQCNVLQVEITSTTWDEKFPQVQQNHTENDSHWVNSLTNPLHLSHFKDGSVLGHFRTLSKYHHRLPWLPCYTGSIAWRDPSIFASALRLFQLMNTRRKHTATGIPRPVVEQLVEAVNWIMKNKSINLATRVTKNHW